MSGLVLSIAHDDAIDMLREIRRECIASVGGAEHAASLSNEDLDAHLTSTPVDVANLIARTQAAEAAEARLRSEVERVRAELATAHSAAVARAEAAEREHEATKGMVRTLLAVEVEEPETTDDRWDQMKRRVHALVALASRIGGKP